MTTPQDPMHQALVREIDENALEQKSGVMIAFRTDLLERESFKEVVRRVAQRVDREPKTGWGLKIPSHHVMGPHSDSASIVVYFLHDHSSSLWVGDVPFDTREGEMVYIPSNMAHHVEPTGDSPRFTVVLGFFDER
jgi:quercetin dioxygenase-like cupin family protein